MKNNLLKYVLILSLLLNFSFLGAAGYTYYRQNQDRHALYGYGTSERISTGCFSNQPYLFEALSLGPEQRKLLEHKAQLFHESLDRKGEKVDRLRRSLFDLMRADYPDGMSIDATIAEINGIQLDMQKMIVVHMLEFRSMLDRNQQKKFFDLIGGAMASRQEFHSP